jgi:NADPH2:quinone reductase
MKKIICKEFGPVDNLVWEDTEDHEPLPNEVVVDIKAAALNFPDYLIVQGLYQFQPPLPFTPGNEGAGIIKKIGSEVTKHKVGDRVSFMSAIGAFAEEIVLDQNLVFKMQDDMSFEVAASYQLAYGTSYHALVQRGNLSKDDEVLVLGGSGGVGLAAIDIAKAVGARVVAAVSSQEKAQICSDYGANDVVLYGSSKLEKEQQKTFTSELKAKSIKGGFDLIYDPIGDCFAEPSFRSIGWGGRYLVIGFAAGEIPKLPLNLTLLKGASIVGVFWGTFTALEPETNKNNIKKLNQMVADGKIKPLISQTIPMKDAISAINMIGNRGVTGKVVLVNDEE